MKGQPVHTAADATYTYGAASFTLDPRVVEYRDGNYVLMQARDLAVGEVRQEGSEQNAGCPLIMLYGAALHPGQMGVALAFAVDPETMRTMGENLIKRADAISARAAEAAAAVLARARGK